MSPVLLYPVAVATIFFEVDEFSSLSASVSSPPVNLNNMSWNLSVKPNYRDETKFVGLFLYVNLLGDQR